MAISFSGGFLPQGTIKVGRPVSPLVSPLVWQTLEGSLGETPEQVAYSSAFEVVSDGAVTYSLHAGTLPLGLTLAPDGTLSGTPADVGQDTQSSFTIRATDQYGQTADRPFTLTVRHLPTGSQIYSTFGSQTFSVPDGVTEIQVKLWGAGGSGTGASGPAGTSPKTYGGGGGFIKAKLAVTPGESLTIITGGGGTPSGGEGASGGGRSAVRRGATELLTAGAGGGGARPDGTNTNDFGGGAGGGLTGQDGGLPNGGKGGTQSAGGATGGANSIAGSQFQGGNAGSANVAGGFGGGGAGSNAGWGGSGGGGGYYGGGAGASASTSTGAPGGGGSSYIGGAGVSAASTVAGAGRQVAASDDPDYAAGAGMGGLRGAGGGNGRTVILWGRNIT